MAFSVLTLDKRELQNVQKLSRVEQGAGFLPRHCEEQIFLSCHCEEA